MMYKFCNVKWQAIYMLAWVYNGVIVKKKYDIIWDIS